MNKLPHPNDPYVTSSGNIITPQKQTDTLLDGDDTRDVLPRLVKFTPVKVRHKDDRPEKDPKEQAVVNAVVAYVLMGFDVVDIAGFFDISVDDVTSIVKKPSAQRTFEMMFLAIVNNNASNVQGRIASHANKAVDVMLDLMNDTEQHGMVRYRAAADVLDRSGANAEQFFNAGKDNQRGDDELTITIMSEEDTQSNIAVNIKRR